MTYCDGNQGVSTWDALFKKQDMVVAGGFISLKQIKGTGDSHPEFGLPKGRLSIGYAGWVSPKMYTHQQLIAQF